MEKTTYEVGTFILNADPEGYCEFNSLAEAESEFDYQVRQLSYEIKDAMRRNDKCLQHDLSDRTVELNKVIRIYDDDGCLDDCEVTPLRRFGDAADWDAIRKEV